MKHSIHFSAITLFGLLSSWNRKAKAFTLPALVYNENHPVSLSGLIRPRGRDSSWATACAGLRTKRFEQMSQEVSTRLHANFLSPLTKTVSAVSPSVRNALFLGAATLALVKRKQILYPGTSLDPKFSEPLPPGSFGCPFFGINFFQSSREGGPGEFYRRASTKLGNARIFKFMFLGQPIISVSGMKNVKNVFNKEFKSINMGQSISGASRLFGDESLIMCRDESEHSFQRRLVGAAMTPDSIDKATPSLQKTVSEHIDNILLQSTSVMEDICTNFTLDVAWRQILGLQLDESEIPTFRQAVNDWIGGLFNLRVLLLPGVQYTKPGRAHSYLVSLINKKIDDLHCNGPDGSTLSAMVFAKDEFDGSKLTRQQVIDNSLLLILAGSETTASTLTTGILLLGLHPEVFQKMKEEQRTLAATDGGLLSLRQIDRECPYLDAVIKEIMRIKPIAGGSAVRLVNETFSLNGFQIPKGYSVAFNVHLTHAHDPVTVEPDGSHMDVVKGFKPERWLKDVTRPSEFMPFGYGPRYCLGANLAMAEMKIFLSLFARRVDFDLVNMTKDHVTWQKQSIIPKPEDGSVIAASPASWKQEESNNLSRVLT